MSLDYRVHAGAGTNGQDSTVRDAMSASSNDFLILHQTWLGKKCLPCFQIAMKRPKVSQGLEQLGDVGAFQTWKAFDYCFSLKII